MSAFPIIKPKEAREAKEEKEATEVLEVPEVPEVLEVMKGKEEKKTMPQKPEEVLAEPPVIVQVAQPVVPVEKDQLTEQIENILEEDLTELYLSMPKETQQQFKAKGEETLSKIRQLVQKTKVNAKKIFQLIREWLKIIPGVNRFFLEQEAKIKTDKILRL